MEYFLEVYYKRNILIAAFIQKLYRLVNLDFISSSKNIGSLLSEILSTSSKTHTPKQIGVVFDKDFSSLVVLQKLHEDAQKVFHNIDFTHSHAGYCIESVIFSDLIKLKDILFNSAQVLGISCTKIYIEQIVDDSLLAIFNELTNSMSLFNNNMEAKFKSQQRNREENSQISYSDFYRDIIDISKINYILTKDLIEDFFKIYFQKIYFPEIAPINTPETCEECFLFVLNNANSQNFFDDLNLLINKLYQNI